MACGIYKITNQINGKSYIGQAIDIQTRWNKEKTRAFDPNSLEYEKTLSQAFRKYGLNNFTFEIIEQCEKALLNEKEIYYISFYDTYFNGYNETTGGTNGNENACVKIQKNDLLIIYDLLLNSSKSQKEIAEQFNVGQDVISTINHGKSRRLDGYNYPLRNNRNKFYCQDCGKEISKMAIRCEICEKFKQRKVERPSREELKNLIRTETFVSLGKKYRVADKTISKWCEYYNLPSKKKSIKSYTDDQWLLI